MKVLVLVSLVAVASAFEFTAEWEMWKKEHGRDYRSYEEELTRHIIWESNRKFVDNHNENANTFGYTVEMNEYADMTNSEFVQIFNGYKGQNLNRKPGRYFKSNISLEDLPDTVDWRTKGYVTPVKNQGQCGSCWAFSTTGSLEGQHFKATGNLVSLSEQNLVDCSTSEGNEGCNGGLMDDAFEYIIKNPGIDTEASYPYQAHDEKCRFNSANVGATMSSYVDVKSKDESALQQAVATIGPISVAIDASHIGFQLYSGGVYHSYFCSQTRLDHGVLAVGYGTYSGKDYWLVKNSWGASWGLSGYLMMSRNRDNNCGIATQASYPVV